MLPRACMGIVRLACNASFVLRKWIHTVDSALFVFPASLESKPKCA